MTDETVRDEAVGVWLMPSRTPSYCAPLKLGLSSLLVAGEPAASNRTGQQQSIVETVKPHPEAVVVVIQGTFQVDDKRFGRHFANALVANGNDAIVAVGYRSSHESR